MPGTLFVVATPIGNLEDITARALRVLRQVQLIAVEDTRRTVHLLARYAIPTPTTSLHQHNEAVKLRTVLDRLLSGDDVALVSDAGTPTISDPGQQLVQAAIAAGVRVEPIPGPNAVVAALAASGIGGGTFLFLGFPPIRSKDRDAWFEDLRAAARPVVFFEAPHRIRKTLTELQRHLGERHISVAREVTKVHEEFLRGPISDVLGKLSAPIGEFTVVVDVGQLTENMPIPLSQAEIFAEFTRITESTRASRRHVIQQLAKEHGLSPNRVYEAIEQGKKLVK
jgi:16S rRNA (cytidine1402-2'-O)-methyltransferase